MNEPPEKTLTQIAYETFIEELRKTKHAVEAIEMPPWDKVPQDFRDVLGLAIAEAVRSFAPAMLADTDVPTEEQSFAQVGYQSYIASTGGLNYQGKPCPPWAELPPAIQLAWAAASVGIRTEHEHRFAGDYDLAVSKEELSELVMGLDALQRVDKHVAEVCFPLRARLRAVLFPPDPPPQPEKVGDAPELEVGADQPALPEAPGKAEPPDPDPNPATLTEYGRAFHDAHRQLAGKPPLGGHDLALPLSGPTDAEPKGEVIADNALDPVKPATESPATERTDPAPTPEAAQPPGASEGNLAGSAPVELPAVSEAPAAPPFPAPDPAIPPPPALPTDTGPQTPPVAG